MLRALALADRAIRISLCFLSIQQYRNASAKARLPYVSPCSPVFFFISCLRRMRSKPLDRRVIADSVV